MTMQADMKDNNGYALNGQKRYVGNGGRSRLYDCFCQKKEKKAALKNNNIFFRGFSYK